MLESWGLPPAASSPVAPALPSDELYLIDAMGYIFRAYHALPPLTNARGLPTAAVLGVVQMVRKLVQTARPAALAAAFDLAGPTFRDQDFAAYKANRPAMPDTLLPQLPYIRKALEALRVPILEAPGFEADDVIGTVARKAVAAGWRVIVVSSDKDLLQLVGPGVRVYNPSHDQLLDAAGVEARLGVRPGQVADLLALRGDAVDNIPGAPGIGEKGAQQLIARFGSVEAALERAAEVERKTYRESLQIHRDQIALSKSLATISCAAPVEFTPDEWRQREPDLDACRSLFAELEFHQLLRSLDAAPPLPTLPVSEVFDAARAHQFAADADGPLSLIWDDGAGLASSASAAALAPGAEIGLRAALGDPGQAWVFADAKALRARLRGAELPLPAFDSERISDLSLLAYLDDPTASSFGLEAILRRLDPAAPAQFGDAGQAAAAALAAAPRLRQRVAVSGQQSVYADLDFPLIPVLEAMEATGVRLDPAPLALLSRALERRCMDRQEEVFTLAGARFNLNSPQQLADILFTKMGLPAPARRGKTKSLSTAQDVLEELTEHPVIPPILEYRQLAKLKSTYVDALPPLLRPATGRLHTNFVITGSATGRLASTNPNLQNIPIRTELGREIRAAFVPDPGHVLVSADYSQIELRLLAHLSGDPLLLDAYRRNEDIHRLTAAEVFGVPPLLISDEHRRRAKAVNFGIVYGLSAFGLARQLSIPQAEAAKFIKRYFERYAGVQDYIQRTLAEARREARVRTLFGRVRPIPNLDARNPTLRGFAERTAINTPLQGTAADLIKLAMIRLHPRLPALGARMLLQVHDELVFEVPQAQVPALAALARAEMEHVAELAIPLRVEIGAGPNWRDLESLP